MSPINFLPTFPLLSRISSKRISCLHHWVSSAKSCSIDRNIVDTIVGDMLFDLVDESDNDENANVEDHVFGSEAEFNALMHLRLEVITIAKSRALALFKQIQCEADDNVNDEVQFSYLVTIPKTKITLFSLVVCYVSCEASFQMASNIIGCTYDVLATLVYTLVLTKMSGSSSGLSMLLICSALLMFYDILGVSQ